MSDLDAIKAVEIAKFPSDDTWIWKGHPSGKATSRGAFIHLKNLNTNTSECWYGWRDLCSLPLRPLFLEFTSSIGNFFTKDYLLLIDFATSI